MKAALALRRPSALSLQEDDLSDDDTGFSCVLAFPDQSESFVLGFEAAPYWQRLRNGETLVKTDGGFPVHQANDELFERMATAAGYAYSKELVDGCWMNVRFEKRTQARFAVITGGASQ